MPSLKVICGNQPGIHLSAAGKTGRSIICVSEYGLLPTAILRDAPAPLRYHKSSLEVSSLALSNRNAEMTYRFAKIFHSYTRFRKLKPHRYE